MKQAKTKAKANGKRERRLGAKCAKAKVGGTVEGKVILRKAYVISLTDLLERILEKYIPDSRAELQKVKSILQKSLPADRFSARLQQKVSFQLVSSDQIDEGTSKGKRSSPANLESNSEASDESKDSTHGISFDWAPEWGTPGAVVVINNNAREFFLKELKITVPGKKKNIRFLCNSWIYPGTTNIRERVFFANNNYLPDKTPRGLAGLRTEEVESLKGDGNGKRKASDRIYDYDVYNDLGDRKVLGRSQEFPYPRRCRTGRPLSKSSPAVESRVLQHCGQSFYIPADEQFSEESQLDFAANSIRALPRLVSDGRSDFADLEDVKNLYMKKTSFIEEIIKEIFKDTSLYSLIKGILKVLCNTAFREVVRFPLPNIISRTRVAISYVDNEERYLCNTADGEAWKTDEEFARQTLSGLNPMVIRCLQSFPPSSKLNAQIYGPQESSITGEHIVQYLEGMSVEEAIKSKRLFILDYYDAYIPYVEVINKLPSGKTYATRTIFFLGGTGTLKPVAIELCLPPTSAGFKGLRRVYTPDSTEKEQEWLWQLAKSHVRGNDSGYHQLVNHWLRTHAVVEPFIIATQRNLSKLHPIHKLLLPHFRNTMQINANARQYLINAGGIIEQCFTSGEYSMEISANAYKEWRFNEQGLPADLLKRGMVVPDSDDKTNGLKLVIEDYPYAVDGLEIWAALQSWVSDYTSFYYNADRTVQSDTEVQAWWKDIVEVGHGDKKHDVGGWYKMKSVKDLTEAITTLIWIASAHHAAVNFGQYGYAGFMPNHPSATRKLIPERGDTEYPQFLRNEEAYFLKTVSDPKTTQITMAILEILSQHSGDEIYLGQDSPSNWVDDHRIETAFGRFRSELQRIEQRIEVRNKDQNLKNRCGPANVPYTLLYPTSHTGGLTFKGIPNSVSI